MTWPLFVVYVAWVLAVMEPDWFLTKQIGGPFYRIPTLMIPVLLILIVAKKSKRAIYWPFIFFMLLHLGASLFALNAGYSRMPFKFIMHMLLLFVTTVSLVDTPAKLTTLLKIYLVGFLWYGIQGLPNGRVSWHPLLGNEDSFGPLMGMAVGFGYYFAQSIHRFGWKLLGYASSGIGMIGVVAANARGAVVALGLVLFMVWLRSPRKVATLGAGLVAAGVAVVAIETMFPSGAFWEEMSTISSGASEGTGQKRLEMWKMSWPVFLENPIFGVGAGNFGVVAVEVIPYDESRPMLRDPKLMYSLQLHNVFVQIFCETGIIGLGSVIWMLVVFAGQLRYLRSEAVVRAWRRRGRGAADIYFVSLALELAMIAFLANAFFYNQTYIHWFWTLITLTFASHEVARRTVRGSSQIARRKSKPTVASQPGTPAGGLLSGTADRDRADSQKPSR